ncbi:MAG TPA: cytochrome c-type biogenesis CcmF C-terminal domain-containing protein [Pirellulaceae bacterium]|nr:cytochrome c-type biogenesis CcmF C-terminal domain-containing protein [Pirellulaceae bacterium]
MRILGEICLLASLVTSGYGALVTALGDEGLKRRGKWAGALTAVLLTAVLVVLAGALIVKDFSFDYVAQYSSTSLPWHYSLSAVWVGQAGSLLLWAWLLSMLTIVFRATARDLTSGERYSAHGVLLACTAFLVAIMVFAADPMQPNLLTRTEGSGLSPLLQHPAMLIHPPIVFLGYATWTIPFALSVAALWHGAKDERWTRTVRNWSLLAWLVLGTGILLGADWAYQELGWGGYWGWDPVENGSLVPWLTGTAMIHSLMAWRYRNCLKKTTVALAIATFGLCNFATFLTRSGIFSSVHAFSQSPIGWLFLGLMCVLAIGGAVLIYSRRAALATNRPTSSVFSRESMILISVVLLSLLTAVVVTGTIVAPVTSMWFSRTVQFGPEFYNRVLAPIGVALLAMTAVVPLVRWGRAPGPQQLRLLGATAAAAVAATLVAAAFGVRSTLGLTVTFFASLSLATLAAAWWLDARRRSRGHRDPRRLAAGLASALRDQRRRYAGYVIHLGFTCLAVGVTGSSLGTFREEMELDEGQTIQWQGWSVTHSKLDQRETPDKLIAEATLSVRDAWGREATLHPARHFHTLQEEWTSEVAIDSSVRGDLYIVLHAGLGEGRIFVSLISNPLLAWLWIGGWLCGAGAIVALVPSRRHATSAAQSADDESDDDMILKFKPRDRWRPDQAQLAPRPLAGRGPGAARRAA